MSKPEKFFISWVQYKYYCSHENKFDCDVIYEHPLKWLEEKNKNSTKIFTLLWWKELE